MDREQALANALDVFLRYGYRKASMEDLARAVGVSRQWLYLQFGSKEQLFQAGVEHELASCLAHAQRAAADESLPVSVRLLGAFDGWCGVNIDRLRTSPHADEILDSAHAEHAALIEEYCDRFLDAIESVVPVSESDGVSPRSRVVTLGHVSDALKRVSRDRETYLAGVREAIAVVCPHTD